MGAAVSASSCHGVRWRRRWWVVHKHSSCSDGRGEVTTTPGETIAYIDGRLDFLKESRPTAQSICPTPSPSSSSPSGRRISRASTTPTRELPSRRICRGGREHTEERPDGEPGHRRLRGQLLQGQSHATAEKKISVLTHCNTGSLATSGHGTALGIIRSLHSRDLLQHAFCTETRPYNQGSRLTSFELVFEGIPSTLITDSMAGALFALQKEQRNIAAVIVGADRVVRNGDTANKIGTYSLAVLARYHNVKFVVAAPTTSIDLETETGGEIKIEERKREEMTQISGPVVRPDGSIDASQKARVAIADQQIAVWNPAFDVTPHELIDAIVTEKGTVVKNKDGQFDFRDVMPDRWVSAGLSIDKSE